jgi:hypothetical protein
MKLLSLKYNRHRFTFAIHPSHQQQFSDKPNSEHSSITIRSSPLVSIMFRSISHLLSGTTPMATNKIDPATVPRQCHKVFSGDMDVENLFLVSHDALNAQLQLITLHFKFLTSYTNRLHYFNSATLNLITSAMANRKPRDEQEERPRK